MLGLLKKESVLEQELRENLSHGVGHQVYFNHTVAGLLSKGEPNIAESTFKAVIHFLGSPIPSLRIQAFGSLGLFTGCGIPPLERDSERRIKDTLESVGLDPEATYKEWKAALPIAKTFQNPYLRIADHISTILQVEQARPGEHVCKTLQDSSSISLFGLYPWQMLLEQYDNLNNHNSSYFLVATAKEDWNGVLSLEHAKYGIFRRMLGKGGHIKFIESGGSEDLLDSLSRVGHDYGLAVGAEINAHGFNTGFTLSSGPGGTFATEDVNRGAPSLRTVLGEGSTLILKSCSTGQRDGVAQQLSAQMRDVTVIGPDERFEFISKSLSRSRGCFDFGVEYKNNVLEIVPAMYWRNGALANVA